MNLWRHSIQPRPRVLSLVLVAVAVGAGVWGYLYAQSGGAAPKYRIAPVERGPLVAAVSATGSLNAVITVQVGSQVSGQIKELFVDFNSVVKKRQAVARIDPDIFEAKVVQARADLDSAKAAVLNQRAQIQRARADVENARAAHAEAKAQTAKAQIAVIDTKRDLGRKTELFARQLIAKSDLDSSQALHDSAVAQFESAKAHDQALASAIQSAVAQLGVAEAMLESARAQVEQKDAGLKQAQIDLDHTTILAPVDGVVVSRQVDVGQTVATSLSAPTLFTIAQDLTKMQVETSVDEADIGRVRIDGPTTFTVDAFPGEKFSGRIVQIRKAAQIVQNVVTYTVVVAVDNPDRRLLPGMTANVKLLIAEKRSVLKVPNAALRFRPPGGDSGFASAPHPERSAQRGEGSSPLKSLRRLVRGLGLTAEQQAKVDLILEDSRQQMLALQGAGLAEQEHQARAQKIGEVTRAGIREILTPAQRARYDQSAGGDERGGVAGRAGVAGRVWVPGPDGRLQPVALTLGLSDGTMTEVLGGALGEGHAVVIGLAGGSKSSKGGGAPRLRL